MKIIYSQQPIPNRITKSIFLAGCTNRTENEGISWRLEAITFLENIGFDGTVFMPEYENTTLNTSDAFDYAAQIEWEDRCLAIADKVIFWLNRKLDVGRFGLTSNVEFGKWMNSGKVYLGYPPNADKINYLLHHAEKLNIKTFTDLKRMLIEVIDDLGDGAERLGTDVLVPLDVWNHQGFKNWHKGVYDCGNMINDIKIEYTKIVGTNILFFITVWADIYIRDENRNKSNEVVFIRSDISSCLLYKKDPLNILNSDIVLVREFRTPVNNITGKVWEIAGGSSFKDGLSPSEIITQEIKEELGIDIEPNRLVYHQARQLQATTLSHKSHLFYCEITDEELEYLISQKNIVKGDEISTERTYTEVVKLESILDTEVVDWANIGQIMSILMLNK